MKRIILLLLMAVSITACAKIDTEPVKAETIETENTYMVDIREIESYQETETGLQLNIKNGTEIHVDDAKNVTEYVYPICDVVGTYEDYPTELEIDMPDGSIHWFNIQDPPKELEEVVFQTIDQDNYKTYKIVGAR